MPIRVYPPRKDGTTTISVTGPLAADLVRLAAADGVTPSELVTGFFRELLALSAAERDAWLARAAAQRPAAGRPPRGT